MSIKIILIILGILFALGMIIIFPIATIAIIAAVVLCKLSFIKIGLIIGGIGLFAQIIYTSLYGDDSPVENVFYDTEEPDDGKFWLGALVGMTLFDHFRDKDD